MTYFALSYTVVHAETLLGIHVQFRLRLPAADAKWVLIYKAIDLVASIKVNTSSLTFDWP
jgi:hypothetical protein